MKHPCLLENIVRDLLSAKVTCCRCSCSNHRVIFRNQISGLLPGLPYRTSFAPPEQLFVRANRSDSPQLCFLSIQVEHLHESGREYSGKNSNKAHCELDEPLRHLHATRTRHSLSVVHGERELLFALAGTHPLH